MACPQLIAMATQLIIRELQGQSERQCRDHHSRRARLVVDETGDERRAEDYRQSQQRRLTARQTQLHAHECSASLRRRADEEWQAYRGEAAGSSSVGCVTRVAMP